MKPIWIVSGAIALGIGAFWAGGVGERVSRDSAPCESGDPSMAASDAAYCAGARMRRAILGQDPDPTPQPAPAAIIDPPIDKNAVTWDSPPGLRPYKGDYDPLPVPIPIPVAPAAPAVAYEQPSADARAIADAMDRATRQQADAEWARRSEERRKRINGSQL